MQEEETRTRKTQGHIQYSFCHPHLEHQRQDISLEEGVQSQPNQEGEPEKGAQSPVVNMDKKWTRKEPKPNIFIRTLFRDFVNEDNLNLVPEASEILESSP